MKTLTELNEKLKGKMWSKNGIERIYLDRGHNTKKMKTTTYVELKDDEFVVKCFIDCPSQDWNWIKSQQEQVIEGVEEDIETILNPKQEISEVEEVELTTVERVVKKSDVVVDYYELDKDVVFKLKEELNSFFSKEFFATSFQKPFDNYSFKVSKKEIKNAESVIKNIDNYIDTLNNQVLSILNFRNECSKIESQGYKICGNSLIHGQAQIMKNGKNIGHIHGMNITL